MAVTNEQHVTAGDCYDWSDQLPLPCSKFSYVIGPKHLHHVLPPAYVRESVELTFDSEEEQVKSRHRDRSDVGLSLTTVRVGVPTVSMYSFSYSNAH